MDKTRAESFELLCEALGRVDYNKLDNDLWIVILQSINLLRQYHAAESVLGQVELPDDKIIEEYDWKKTQLTFLETLEKLMNSKLSQYQKGSNSSK